MHVDQPQLCVATVSSVSCPYFLSICWCGGGFSFFFFWERGAGLRWAFDLTELLGEMFMFDGVHWPTF